MNERAKKISNISAIAMLIFTAITLLAKFIHNIFIPANEYKEIFDYMFGIVEYVVKILVIYFFFVFMCNKKDIKPAKLEKKIDGVTTVAIIIWTTCTLILLGGAYSIFLTGPSDVIPLAKGMNPIEHIVIIIVYVLFPAIFDEIVFRGLFGREYVIFGITPMFLFSSLVYSLSKFSLTEFPYLFICGLFFCFIYYFTGSLTPVIITHLFYSTISYCIKLLQVSTDYESYRQIVGIIYIIFGVIFVASIVLIAIKSKNIKLEEKEHLLSYKFFTPLMLIFVVLAIALTIIFGSV